MAFPSALEADCSLQRIRGVSAFDLLFSPSLGNVSSCQFSFFVSVQILSFGSSFSELYCVPLPVQGHSIAKITCVLNLAHITDTFGPILCYFWQLWHFYDTGKCCMGQTCAKCSRTGPNWAFGMCCLGCGTCFESQALHKGPEKMNNWATSG